MSRVTALHLGIVLHYHVNCDDLPNIHSPAARQFAEELLSDGMIQRSTNPDRGRYETTERGAAWLEALLTVPFPTQTWKVEWPSQ